MVNVSVVPLLTVTKDDEVTIKQKIDYANSVGLGGVLIWSVDQDTVDLKALAAVLAPRDVKAFLSVAEDTAYWAVCIVFHGWSSSRD